MSRKDVVDCEAVEVEVDTEVNADLVDTRDDGDAQAVVDE